ncbi:uncharacterized protein K460DRAFT_324284 [Cucurbitaria berberidis CBS 394.84]|uniref:Galactose oxidase n=1 Tax=Cucurbitaria berberidis CBS 394.84 TaxID=1168544 RepID=A0A9P4GNH1_9PLEO|nr:uncharacterized protein K460DRAFT_324284 [Cucurbitaria berberidis CBS 394.84]KAF1849718.1 hypothetical protein K460DRAFT_324284 [Cucurbitaria berberidis CBS 394.84]
MPPLSMPLAAPWCWLALLLLPATMAQMPYNPTRILQHDRHLYVFQPSSHSDTQFQLGSIDVSSQVVAANIPYTTLHPTLPFLDDHVLRPFTPILDNGGNLTVYTGDCTQGASGGQVWSYTPEKNGKGSWSKESVSVKGSKHAATLGANFLNGGMAFSSIVGGDTANTGAYFFGGMCPNQNETTDAWQSSANYSNFMVTLQPSSTGSKGINYQLDLSSSRGPPIPEAGFTMTGLSPTFSNRSDNTQTQQQNFVLVGGHTSAAFINMSQVALFSLPEQGWTFIEVQQPDASHTNLAIRKQTTAVDPRSGHTAVLTPDGQRIIVLGGWVGDINTPAEPQYAILNVADGYGGDGDWQWTVPSTSGAGLPDNSGLYGHGATMLPGGVMMITGGYSISPSDSRRKRATPTVNNKAYFLNVTSNTWTTDYSPPPESSRPELIKTGPLSSPGQKAGLGVGLGIGLAAVCALFAFYMWYTRRLKKQREMREKQLQALALGAHRYNIEEYSPGFDGCGGPPDASDYLADQNDSYYFPPGTQGGQGWRAANRTDAERTGLLVEIPSPTRGLRRSLSNRPGYAMGRVRGPGHIHPIDELEEEPDEEQAHDKTPLTKQPEMTERRQDRGPSILENAPVLDPFTDPHGRCGEQKSTHRTSPTVSFGEEPTAASDRRASSPTGRLSPDKSTSERTSSNLSERSARSNLSWTSSSGGVIRSASIRASAILNHAAHANPFKTPDASPTHDKPRRNSESGRQSPEDPRTQSLTSIRSNGYAEIDHFHTAHSSFAHLQVEGEALLGGNPERNRPGTASSNSNTYHDSEGSNSRAATATPATSIALDVTAMSRPGPRERRRSWLGSVRKVLTRSTSGTERTRSLTTTMSYHEPYTDNPISTIEASIADHRKSFPATSAPPRRAASDASFWRNRRGKQDWLDDEQDPTWRRNAGDDWGAPEDIAMAERERQRHEWRERGNLLVNTNIDNDDQLPTPRTPIRPDQLGVPATEDRPCTPASEGDWDVEAAVERRVVQVMFTVPKSKLRVVNADIDRSSILSVPREDDEMIGDSGSPPSRVKDLAGRFEQMSSSRTTPRTSPRPSPSPSIKSMKIRSKASSASLGKQGVR